MPGGIDFEVRSRFHPEKPTQLELEGMERIDPTEAGIFAHKLLTIVGEGNETLMKLGASTGCRWGDTACAIYTTSGDNAATATGLFFHAVLGSIPAKYVAKHWLNDPAVGVKPGDAFFCSDPFYAGVHAPDMGVISPIFYKDRLVCYVGALNHTGECGACEPGGMPTTSKSIYDEGIQFPPVKIAENYILREDLLNAINHMVRDPRVMTLDIKAKIAATRVVEKRLQALLEKIGPDYFMAMLRYKIDSTAQAAKKRISQLNDGIFRDVQFLDAVGPLSKLLKIAITLEKKGDTLYLDYDGTSPQTEDRSANCIPIGIIAIQMTYFMCHLFYDLPHNSGILEPLRYKIPVRSFLNADRELPKAGSPFTMDVNRQTMWQVINKAISSVMREFVLAQPANSFNTVVYGGINQYGAPFADAGAEMNADGFGARFDKDGVHVAGASFAPMSSEPGEVESLEAALPFLYLYRGLHRDSCGHGKFRGGAGMDYAIAVYDVPGIAFGSWGYNSKATSNKGIFGGYASPVLPFVRIFNTNLREMMTSKEAKLPCSSWMTYEGKQIKGTYQADKYPSPPIPMKEYEIVAGGSGGGGGYGDPLERDPWLVMKDIEDGIISHRSAREIYKVAYDENALLVDEEKTKILREEERMNRRKRGISFEEFEKEWLKKRPPEEILEYYGEWPEKKYESFSYFGSYLDKEKE
ncbi:MAG: hydantoinase B/oxoprolinase family protein [Dethiobacter sp.]|jgi:acetophenone carboxylase|nr:MAG: hydantoinase B/oxoprolinase family protein [Dethiobacter sp.]